MTIQSNGDIEKRIKAIISTFCDDQEFIENVKRNKKIDMGEAFYNQVKRGNIDYNEYKNIKDKVKRTYDL